MSEPAAPRSAPIEPPKPGAVVPPRAGPAPGCPDDATPGERASHMAGLVDGGHKGYQAIQRACDAPPDKGTFRATLYDGCALHGGGTGSQARGVAGLVCTCARPRGPDRAPPRTEAGDRARTEALDAMVLAGAEAEERAAGVVAATPERFSIAAARGALAGNGAGARAYQATGGNVDLAISAMLVRLHDAIHCAGGVRSPNGGRQAGSLSRAPGAPWGPWATGPEATPVGSATRAGSLQGRARTEGAGVALGSPNKRARAASVARGTAAQERANGRLDTRAMGPTPETTQARAIRAGLLDLRRDYSGAGSNRTRKAIFRRCNRFAHTVGLDPAHVRAIVAL